MARSGTVEVHAVVERASGAAAWGTRRRTVGWVEALQVGHRRFAPSRRRLEARALRRALEEALADGWEEVRVEIADPRGGRWLEEGLAARAKPADPELARLQALAGMFRSVRVAVVPSLADPALERTVHLALDEELKRVGRERTGRVREIERLFARARTVEVERTPSGFLAHGRYQVRLDPPSCDCPAWIRRWDAIPLAGRRARRLPCKHIVAAAMLEGAVTPADLERLVRSARR